MQIAYVDHYDSFSNNLLAWMEAYLLAKHVSIRRVYADDSTSMAALTASPMPLVLSPGPGRPTDFPLSTSLLAATWGRYPILGVCLGLQMICVKLGGTIAVDWQAHHGNTRPLRLLRKDSPLVAGVADGTLVATYNSLGFYLEDFPLPESVVATDSTGLIQAIHIEGNDIAAFQFHPESFMTECSAILANNALGIFLKR